MVVFFDQVDHFVTAEAVAQGHPDKVADLISDSLLDYYLSMDSESRVALETMVVSNKIFVGGEVSSRFNPSKSELENVVRTAISNIIYQNDSCFNSNDVQIEFVISEQSNDIAKGICGDFPGAGDQGTMYGYATDEISSMIPAPIHYAQLILKNIMKDIASGVISGLGMDAKTQVTLRYSGLIPVSVANIVLSIQHSSFLSSDDVRNIVYPYIIEVFPSNWICEDDNIFINSTGIFTVGGPVCDCGLTGRKLMVDTYGGIICHGGGAFSGKDATKVDRSGAYMARYVAKNIVLSGLAKRCVFKLSYAIGRSQPLDISLYTFGTSKVDEVHLLNYINDILSFAPKDISDLLNLRLPIYARTACYGHFGRAPEKCGGFSWEKGDIASVISKEFGHKLSHDKFNFMLV